MKIRNCLLILYVLITASCASIDTNKVAPGYFQAFNAIQQLISGNESTIDKELIQNIPYASILVRIGKGPEALMILEKKIGEELTWVSADGIYIVTNKGKIIQTHGLSNNLSEKISLIDGGEILKRDEIFHSYYSFKNPTLNNLKISSRYTYVETKEIKLKFGIKKLRLIEEKISSDEVGWYETNEYWLDDSNYVWKSVQSISPKLPKIFIEVTKKPR